MAEGFHQLGDDEVPRPLCGVGDDGTEGSRTRAVPLPAGPARDRGRDRGRVSGAGT
jgi:hypothetical protein